jgi:hypothetical protein
VVRSRCFLYHNSSSLTAMSQEQYANKRPRHAPDAAAMSFPQRAFVGPTPNMVPLHPMFGAGAMGDQQYLHPTVPSVPFPGTYPRYPPVPQLVFPFLGQNSILSRRATSKIPSDMASHNNTNMQSAAGPNMQHPAVRDFLGGGTTSSSLSKEETPIPRLRGATREFLEDDSTTSGPSKSEAPARKLRGASQERRDSLTQQTPPPASLTKRSRLPSNDTSRKAPLRAAPSPLSDSEDEDYNDSGQKRPKAKQQRLSAKPNGAVSKKRARHSSTPVVDPKNILNRRRQADITDLEKYQAEPPRQLPEVGLFSPPNITTRSRPRHKYMVPGKLQGTANALGKPIPSTQNPVRSACQHLRSGHLERVHSPNGKARTR